MAVAPARPKILLFDLGGVIVPWVGLEALADLNKITRDEVAERFNESEVFSAFERGNANEVEFLTELRRIFTLPDTDLVTLWNSWVRPPFPGTLEALADLKTRFTTACLSNINTLHWTHLNRMFNVENTFDFAFASHMINEAKPDALSYKKPIETMGCKTEDIWFFDDTQANLEGARAVGLTAFHVDRAAGVLPLLRDLGLLP